MATKKSSKQPKRKARDSDRAYAAELVRRYFQRDPYRIEITGARFTDAPAGPVTYTHRVDGDELAIALHLFAKRGTFDEHRMAMRNQLTFSDRNELIRDHVARLHNDHRIKKTRAIGMAADAFHVSDQTVKNVLSPRKKRAKRKP